MFTQMIDLKGLVIYLKNDMFGYDKDWFSISSLLPCVFIASSETQHAELTTRLHPKSIIILVSVPFFGLKQALTESLAILKLQPFEVAFLSNDYESIKSLLNDHIGTILIRENSHLPFNYHGHAADFIVSELKDINNIISGDIKGYFGEVKLTSTKTGFLDNRGYIFSTSILINSHECNVYLLGRYYDNSHPKNNVHQYSHRIIKSKWDDSQNHLFSDIISPMISILGPDGVTRVPPRPSASRDRLKSIVSLSIKNLVVEDLTDSLICIKEYSNHKILGREARIANVSGVFQAGSDVEDKHIVLIDDVLTTGATVSECASELLKSGAKKISIIILASHQFTPDFLRQKNLPCPSDDCSGLLKLKINKYNQFFYGCSNYLINNCKHSTEFHNGKIDFCKLNLLDNDTFDNPDIDF